MYNRQVFLRNPGALAAPDCQHGSGVTVATPAFSPANFNQHASSSINPPATPPTAVVDDVELDILSSEWVTPDGLKSVHPTDQSGVATLTRVTIDAAVVDLRILTTATPTRLEVAQFTDIGPTGVPAGESGTIDCLAPTATCWLDDSTQQEIRALITPGSATKALVIQAGFSVDPRSVKRLTRRTPLSSSVSWGFLYDHGA